MQHGRIMVLSPILHRLVVIKANTTMRTIHTVPPNSQAGPTLVPLRKRCLEWLGFKALPSIHSLLLSILKSLVLKCFLREEQGSQGAEVKCAFGSFRVIDSSRLMVTYCNGNKIIASSELKYERGLF